MKWRLRQKITLISLFIVCTFLAICHVHNNDILQAKALPSFARTDTQLPTQNGLLASPTLDGSPIPTATIDPSYEPAYWGLPAQMGGYEIMVVVSSENEKCSPPNQLQLLLHAIPDQPQTLTTADVKKLETLANRTIQLTFLSGVVSIQQVQSQMEEWNAAMAGGCISLGDLIPTFTPNPDDPISLTSYDPKFWSLPETIAGTNY